MGKHNQIFMSINPSKMNVLTYGLFPGANTVTKICEEHKNLNRIPLESKKEELLETIIDFYSQIIPEYIRLNYLEKKYRNYKNIKCWFVSPQPPDEIEKPVKGGSYEKSIFEMMMNQEFFALGWSELTDNLYEVNLNDVEIEAISEEVISMYKIIKKDIEIGDIIIAKKGGPDKKIYSIGFVTSDYKHDKNLDENLKIKRYCYHYRDTEWVVNFYKDFKENILKNDYFISIKSREARFIS